MKPFLEEISHRVLLADGAMGTLLLASGFVRQPCLEALVTEHPEVIAGIHAAYVGAGAEVVSTHTFGANRIRLALHGLENRVAEFNQEAVGIAHEVRDEVGVEFYIAGNIGPVGKHVKWDSVREVQLVEEAYREQIGTLVMAGVDLLHFETFSDVAELEVAVGIAREASMLPIVASMSFGTDELTLAGQRVGEVCGRLQVVGADVIGVNCSGGPAQVLNIVRKMQQEAPKLPYYVAPNAGLPTQSLEGGFNYPIGATEFATYLDEYLELGARLIGGCCGTTPETISALSGALVNLDRSSPRQRQSHVRDHGKG